MSAIGAAQGFPFHEQAVILDFDRSVALPESVPLLDLREFEERVRFCASFADMERLEGVLAAACAGRRLFFLGSGDFHHVSYLLIKHRPETNLEVIVFDNHPDNMFLPAGIHCGSWVYHAGRLPNVARVTVFGICSGDLRGLNLLQNRFSVLRSGKVKYYCLAPVSRAARFLSGSQVEEVGVPGGEILEAVSERVRRAAGPLYLSIDKDVLCRDSLTTTWDQGRLAPADLLRCVAALSGRVAAADVVGDLSSHRYRGLLKRALRRLDGGERLPSRLEEERLKHRDLNLKLLALLAGPAA